MQTPVASRQTALPGKTARAEKGCVAEYARTTRARGNFLLLRTVLADVRQN